MEMNETKSSGLLNSAEGLRKLILENPTLPLLVFAGEDCNYGDYSYMSCSYVNASVGEFLDCLQTVNDELCFTDRDEFKEEIADRLSCEDGIESLSDKEFDERVEKEAAQYEPYWKPCIILYVNN
jgi:hypothetical protein|nr:MAG TPA: hypothetical protein [Caudoviricetes sp.]